MLKTELTAHRFGIVIPKGRRYWLLTQSTTQFLRLLAQMQGLTTRQIKIVFPGRQAIPQTFKKRKETLGRPRHPTRQARQRPILP
jgi:hypothetical protein